MQLFAQYYPGPSHASPLIILHGLLGSSDNWHSVARRLSAAMPVVALDARNHGRSPHSDVFSYEVMAEDVREFLRQQGLPSVNLLGHSMGGKTAMQLALSTPELVEKIVVVDIAPKRYDPRHDKLFQVLSSFDVSCYSSRKEIEAALSKQLDSPATVQLVLKNLRRAEDGSYRWKVHLPVLLQSADELNRSIGGTPFEKPALFLRGERSEYIRESDRGEILSLFPRATIVTIPGAGHWVHADAPEAVTKAVLEFLV